MNELINKYNILSDTQYKTNFKNINHCDKVYQPVKWGSSKSHIYDFSPKIFLCSLLSESESSFIGKYIYTKKEFELMFWC